jgi:PTH1 family peptidyl-tRNA hydrolase
LKLIFGIGNPGSKYSNTRHNTGFLILDKFAKRHNLYFKPTEFQYILAGSSISGTRFFLVKPTTYVNLVGYSVIELKERFKFQNKDLLIVTDDINLPFGKIRIRRSGGDGGHNGIYSIIHHLGTEDIPRLRFGIGNDINLGSMKEYVLSNFNNEEKGILEENFNLAVDLIEQFIVNDIQSMLNYYSRIKDTYRFKEQTNNSN